MKNVKHQRLFLVSLWMLVLAGGGGVIVGVSAGGLRPSSSHRLDVYIAGFFPYGDGVENSATGRGVMPSVKLALEQVNEHATILRNFRLHMWWNDTECNAAVGVKSFFDMMHSGPHKMMLFGAACTHVTDPIAKASKHWHLTQLSYADTHPMFTKEAFPNFFRVVPSENAFNAPRLALLKRFNWTRVGTLYQNEPRYSLPHNHMVADLDQLGMEVVETQSFVQDVGESLRKLKEKDVRVILANFNELWARKVFCEAFRLEMFGRSYQWLVMGTYNIDWWLHVNETDCTQEELKTALESAILTDLLPLSTSGDITISGITPNEYLTEYDKRRGGEYSRFHGYTYDGIWAVALAIQYVAQRKDQFITNFQYRVKEWENVFIEALRNTSFEGVTGPVRFYNNERKASILLKQFQMGEEVKIGEYSSLNSHLDLSLGEPLKWVGRSPPKDRTVLLVEHSQVNLTIYVVLASCSTVGIVMATTFLIVNIKFRNQRYIKMSSPHLNNLIIIGCMLTYMSVIFLGLDSGLSSVAAFPYICTARAWLLMAGFSLAFGAMFSKTWRVHSIFTDLKLNKKVIKDYQLFMVVGVLLTIDLAIMTTWQIFDPFYRFTKTMEPRPHPSLDDVLIVRENEYCQSEKITIFIGVIYAYKGLLLVFGAFLAWETRHVSIPALNDSKHIGLSVYNVVIMCVMGAAIAIVLSDRKDASFILISVFIIFCTTATLCLVFVPKIVELRRNPSGVVDKRIRATLRPMSKNRRDSSVCELEQRLRDVKSTNCKFRKALMEREAELQALIRKLGPEARAWLDSTLQAQQQQKLQQGGPPHGDGEGGNVAKEQQQRLSVPPIRRELPSTTETTDLTSIGSLASTAGEMEALTPNQRKRVTTISSGSDVPITQPLLQQQHRVTSTGTLTDDLRPQSILKQQQPATASTPVRQQQQSQQQQQVAAVQTEDRLVYQPQPQSDRRSLYSSNKSLNEYNNGSIGNIMNCQQHSTTQKCSPGGRQHYQPHPPPQESFSDNLRHTSLITHSNSDLNQICPHGKGSSKNLNGDPQRRVSVQMGATSASMITGRSAGMGLGIGAGGGGGGSGVGQSVPAEAVNASSAKGNFVVSQSDLWDTHTLNAAKQRQSPRNCPQNRCQHGHLSQQQQQQQQQVQMAQQFNTSNSNLAGDSQPPTSSNYNSASNSPSAGAGYMQRSVSEKNRSKHRHKPPKASVLCQSETDSEREQGRHDLGTMCGPGGGGGGVAQPRKLAKTMQQHSHHHSSPNVAPPGHHRGGGGGGHHYRSKVDSSTSSIYNACSESELLDGETAILPIFRKLLTEREPRYRTRNMVGASCPNISIKCDIVEYL